MKKREPYRMIILEPAKTRIANGLCPVCEKPKSEWKRRKDWRCCSAECTGGWPHHVIYGWPDLRMKAFKRDGFKCVKCGIRPKKRIMLSRKDELGFDDYYWKEVEGSDLDISSELIGDHIIPIAIGGDQWDINNVQTLCQKCDKIKTKQDQIDIAKARQIERKRINQTQLNKNI